MPRSKRSTMTTSRSEPMKVGYEIVNNKVDKLVADVKKKRSDRELLESQSRVAARALYDLRHLIYLAIESAALHDLEACKKVLDDVTKMTDNAKLQVAAHHYMLVVARQKEDADLQQALDFAKSKKFIKLASKAREK